MCWICSPARVKFKIFNAPAICLSNMGLSSTWCLSHGASIKATKLAFTCCKLTIDSLASCLTICFCSDRGIWWSCPSSESLVIPSDWMWSPKSASIRNNVCATSSNTASFGRSLSSMNCLSSLWCVSTSSRDTPKPRIPKVSAIFCKLPNKGVNSSNCADLLRINKSNDSCTTKISSLMADDTVCNNSLFLPDKLPSACLMSASSGINWSRWKNSLMVSTLSEPDSLNAM